MGKPTPPFNRVLLLVNGWAGAIAWIFLVIESWFSGKLPAFYVPVVFCVVMLLFNGAYVLKVLHDNGLSDQ